MKSAPLIEIPQIKLNRDSAITLHEQLVEKIREQILNGSLQASARLPSTREFAEKLNISRNTVNLAYEQLILEGYIESKVGSGTIVSKQLSETLQRSIADLPKSTTIKLSKRGSTYAKAKVTLSVTGVKGVGIPFKLGPALKEIPLALWKKFVRECWSEIKLRNLNYGEPAGIAPLRKAIAKYLGVYRGIVATAEQVIITSGSQQGIELCSRMLFDPSDQIAIEDPSYLGASMAFNLNGVRCLPIPIDEEGLSFKKLAQTKAKGVFVTPSYQYPLGVTMSLKRRFELLNWASKSDRFIIEDDHESEFATRGQPIQAIQGLTKNSPVIYLGSFSKILFPSLRLGYIVLPSDLVSAFENAKSLVDRNPAVIDQLALTRFIEEGYLYRHLRKMRLLYSQRKQHLQNLLRANLPKRFSVNESDGGLHQILWLPRKMIDTEVCEMLLRKNIEALPVSSFQIKQRSLNGLILGFANYDEKALTTSVAALSKALLEFE
jgi:GntR family transcriptional regulator/MocR family aminotransferase